MGRRLWCLTVITLLGLSACGSDADDGSQDDSPEQSSSTDGPIRIGIAAIDPASLLAVFGAEGDDDPFARDKTLIDHINENGGADGRELEPTYFLGEVAADQNAEAQRACETFTTDSPVDIVVTHSANEVLLSCLNDQDIAVIDSSTWVGDASIVDQFPNWILPNALAVDRYAAAAVAISLDVGTLGEGDKLGILYEDCEWGSRVVDDAVRPLASQAGVEVETATVKCITNLQADLGPVTEQAMAAAVRFKSNQVTHVLTLTAAEGFVVGQFSAGAAQQDYRPTYILTTNAYPNNNAVAAGDADSSVSFDAASLENMTGIGWMPHLDVGELEEATPEQAAIREECQGVLPDPFSEQYEDDAAQVNGFAVAYEQCDRYFGIRDILAETGGQLDADSVVTAFRSWAPNSVSLTLSGGTRSADGVGFVQPFTYDSDSGKFVYSGDTRPVG